MSLAAHRQEEFLGGVVYLLTIDMSEKTGNPAHVRRFVNGYGMNGQGVLYQGNTYTPYPYKVGKVSKNQKATKSGSKLKISDNEDYAITRFKEEVGGSLEGARIIELKVFGKFLDLGESPNILNYSKRLDHIVSYVEDSDQVGELIIHTVDPLSRDVKVPTVSFSAGVPNSKVYRLNVFPAVDRRMTKDR